MIAVFLAIMGVCLFGIGWCFGGIYTLRTHAVAALKGWEESNKIGAELVGFLDRKNAQIKELQDIIEAMQRREIK